MQSHASGAIDSGHGQRVIEMGLGLGHNSPHLGFFLHPFSFWYSRLQPIRIHEDNLLAQFISHPNMPTELKYEVQLAYHTHLMTSLGG